MWLLLTVINHPHCTRLCFPSNFDTLSPNVLLPLISTPTSEGVIAYYWSQFNVPVGDLEILPEFTEERILEALENVINKERIMGSYKNMQISEITASSRYHQEPGGTLVFATVGSTLRH